MSQIKKKLLVCGYTYGVPQNRGKIRHLARHFDLKLVCVRFEDQEVFGQAAESIHAGDPGEDFPMVRLSRFPRTKNETRFLLRGLSAEIERFQPDIILCESEPWSMLRWQCWLARKVHCPKAIFVEFSWENLPRSGIKGPILRALYKAAALTGDKFICGNNGAAHLLRAAGVPSENLMVTGQMGVEAEDYKPQTESERRGWKRLHGMPEEVLTIGFCGRFVREKGIRDLVESMDELVTRHPGLCLALLGGGELASELEQLARTRPWLRLLPSVPHDKVPEVLVHFDILVLPSIARYKGGKKVWEEQFGHVLIEAMAAGVLTIGSDSGGIPEVLGDPEVTFRAGDVSSLTKTLEGFLVDPQRRLSKARQQQKQCLKLWLNSRLAVTYRDFITGVPSK